MSGPVTFRRGSGYGDLISLARELKGWTLRDLERECGVSNALLSQIENGQVADPGFSKIVRIADALGIKVERFAKIARPPLDALRAPPTQEGKR